MTRDEKIIAFFHENNRSLRWCEVVCACIGCINWSRLHTWSLLHPDEPHINKEEFIRLKDQVEIPKSETISFTFKSYK